MTVYNNEQNNRLIALSGSDFEIVEGEPDIRSWDVKDITGKKIGEVEDLLFSPETRNVRYLVLSYEDNEFDLDEDRLVLVPIGIAELHPNDDDVIIPAVTTAQLDALPPYKGDVTIEEESAVRNIFENSGATATYLQESFYNHEHFNEVRFYNPRKAVDDHSTRLPVIVNQQTSNDASSEGRPIATDVKVINPLENDIDRENNMPPAINTFPENDLAAMDSNELPGTDSETFIIEEIIIIPDTDASKTEAGEEEDKSKQ